MRKQAKSRAGKKEAIGIELTLPNATVLMDTILIIIARFQLNSRYVSVVCDGSTWCSSSRLMVMNERYDTS